jgi:hypothetical protein
LGILEESRDRDFPEKHRFTSSHDPKKNPRPRPGAIVAVQKTSALAALAALALSALAALLAALSGLLLLLTGLLLAAALLSTLLTTLILLARLLFVGVHICSFGFPPWRYNKRVETKFPKPSARRR